MNDGTVNSDPDTTSITIQVAPNNQPAITSTPVTAATVDVLYTYDVDATDDDGDTLTYSLDIAPAGMTIDTASGLINWIPSAAQVGDNPVTVRVADGEGGFATQSFQVNVIDDNVAPVITSTPVTNATVDDPYTYDVEATDDNGDTLTYSLDVAPAGMTIDTASGLINWTPSDAQLGDSPVTVRVADGAGGFATQSFQVTVIDDNVAPAITSTPVTNATVDDPYTYDVDATDDNGDTLTYSLDIAPAGMTIDTASGLINWTPSDAQLGDNPVTVRVADGEGGFATQSFQVTVIDDNVAPVITSTPVTNATVNDPYTYDVEATDDNGDTLTYSLDIAPAGMTIDTASGLINWTPIAAQVGDNPVTVRVADGEGGFATQSFQVNVIDDNVAPVITSTPVTDAIANDPYTYDVEATDDNGDTLTYSLDIAPAGMTIDTASGLINWTPSDAQLGDNPVTVRVADGAGGFATQSFQVSVIDDNVAPVITSTPVTNATVNDPYTYDVEATDDNGDTLTYSLDTAPAGMTIDTASGLINWTPVAAQVGDNPVTVRVSDGEGGFATQSFQVVVIDDNVAPVITSTPGVAATEGQPYAYDVDAIDDNGDTLTYSLDVAPAGMAIDSASGLINWTPNAGQIGDNPVTVRVDDGAGGFATQSFQVSVIAANTPPAVDAGPDANLNEGQTFVAGGSFVDPDTDSWTATVDYGDGSGPQPLALNPDNTFTLNNTYDDNGTFVVTVTVDDGVGGSGNDTATVTVQNVDPTVDAGPDANVIEGGTFASAGSFVDPGADSWVATVNYGDGGGDEPLALNPDNTFALGNTYPDIGTFTVTVTVTDDDGGVGSDTATVTVSALPTVTIVATDPNAAEAGPDSGEFTVSRTGDLGAALTVNLTIGGSTTNGVDYQAVNSPIVIPAGAADVLIPIIPIDDAIDEGAQDVDIAIAAGAGYAVGIPGVATVSIADDDVPVLTIVAADPAAAEAGVDTGTFTITRTGPTTDQLIFVIGLSGTATELGDYDPIQPGNVFQAGEASVDITVTPRPDNQVEGDETVTATLQASANYDIGVPGQATITIADDPAIVEVVASDADAAEAGQDPGTFTFTRVGGNQALPLTVEVSFSGAATNGPDYGPFGATIQIPANNNSVDITLTPALDNQVEGVEDATITIDASVNYAIGASGNATINIADDPVIATIVASDPNASEVGPDTGEFTITRTGGDITQPLSILTTIGGTATEIADYGNIQPNVTIPANQASAVRTIVPVTDANVEGDETVILTIDASGTNQYLAGVPDSAVVTIAENGLPVANDDVAVTDEDNAVAVPVLVNDTDPNGDVLTITAVTQGANGAVAITGDTVTYTPNLNFNGVDAFTYTITDGNSGNDTATVTVNVAPINDAPIANDDLAATLEDTLVTIDVLANDTDVDLDGLSVASVTQGTAGGTVINNGVDVTYVPPLNFAGVDTFTYVATDGGLNAGATVTVTIAPVNDAPVADAGPAQAVNAGQPVLLDGSGSFDIENDPLTYQWQFNQLPGGSAAVLSDAAAITPTFIADVAGTYVLQLIVNDGALPSQPSQVTITADAAGPTTITLTPPTAQFDTRDTLTLFVTLDAPAPAGGIVIDLLAGNDTVTVPPTVTVAGGATTANVQVQSDLDIGNVNVTASAAGLASDSSTLLVTERQFGLTSPLVGISRTVFGRIDLARPAPNGGATIDLSVLDTTVATIAPATLVIPEGQTQGEFTLTGGATIGATTVTADGTADGYESQSIGITVTDRQIDLPSNFEMFFGEVRSLQILIAPDPAPVGGLQIDVSSDNPGVVSILTPVVIIPEGSFVGSVDVLANSVQAGQARITASNSGFAPDFTNIDVTAALDILQSSESFESTETQEVYFQVLSGGSPLPAPAGGIPVTLSSDDASCVAVTSPSTIIEGETFAGATLSYGGTAALPCSAQVTAANASFGTDVIPVTIEEVPDIGNIAFGNINGLNSVGSSLQETGTINLDTGAHGGITLQIQSSNPALARVSGDAVTAGLPVIEINIPDGTTTANYYVQGVRGATGSVVISATSPSFATGTRPIDVVEPTFQTLGLLQTTTTLAADDPFSVRTYIRNAAGNLSIIQSVSADGPLPVTFISSDPAAGAFTTSTDTSASPVTILMPPNTFDSPNSVAGGGVAFDPLGAGVTTVSATAPGFATTNTGNSTPNTAVTVNQPAITLDNINGLNAVGSSLQDNATVRLGGADHGGVTVTLTSDNAALLLAPDATTPGANTLDVFIPDGQITGTYYVQGASGVTATGVTVTATNGLFTTGTLAVDVLEPTFQTLSIVTNTNTLAADDPFSVRTYIRNAFGNLSVIQSVSAEGPLTVTFTSSDPAVGVFTTTTQTEVNGVTVTMPVNTFDSPGSVAAGGVAFVPLTGGTTTVSATAPGFATTNTGNSTPNVDVTVNQPAITLDNINGLNAVGSSLQSSGTIRLGGADHGGVTVTLTSDNPALRLGPDTTTPGAATLDVFIADGQTTGTYYLQGARSVTATGVTVSATNGLFGTGTLTVDVVEPTFQTLGLITATNTLAADDPFSVRTYIRNVAGNLSVIQGVSPEGPLPVTLTTSDPAVGVFSTSTQTEVNSVTINMAVNTFDSPNSLAQGGAAFVPLAGGTTTVSATAPGFATINTGNSTPNVDVTVSQPAITLDNINSLNDVGSSLQSRGTIRLGGADHGGVTVTLTSDNAAALLALDATTPGAASVDVFIPNGQVTGAYFVQGVRSVTATDITLTAANALFGTGTLLIDVVEPTFQMLSLNATTNTASADDPFTVRAYIRNAAGNLSTIQAVSPEGPLPVTFTSSDPDGWNVHDADANGYESGDDQHGGELIRFTGFGCARRGVVFTGRCRNNNRVGHCTGFCIRQYGQCDTQPGRDGECAGNIPRQPERAERSGCWVAEPRHRPAGRHGSWWRDHPHRQQRSECIAYFAQRHDVWHIVY